MTTHPAHAFRWAGHRCAILTWTLLFLLALSGPANAHPHVWIDAQVTVVLKGAAITELAQQWRFDPFFSSLIIEDFDKNKDGKLDAGETAALRRGAFDNLRNFDFFTHYTIAQQRTGADVVREFQASIERENLVYRFVTPLSQPVDPSKTPLVFSIHDESFYVNVRMPGDWVVTFQGEGADRCTVAMEKDIERPLYMGAFYPTNLRVRCGAK